MRKSTKNVSHREKKDSRILMYITLVFYTDDSSVKEKE